MTQQSLIARLKAVEEALEPYAEKPGPHMDDFPCHRGICTAEKCCRCGRAVSAYRALSDLHELIKEAEQLECYGVVNSENVVEYSAPYPQACHEHINEMLQCDFQDEDAKNWVVRRLFFDALGEKK